ncbi:SMP-30/gluconolactonase/LRE family protein [Halomonas halodenitrificans]|uniref:SMP-30/gluconolactonase/LRE family protein n=1 Tax=Halomonas halodenitrificans TaxID=28252 RepID=UPI000487ADED|nr:SMP-30/gluconolactonase/LRE family protein [Halomonas halodenitrificans]
MNQASLSPCLAQAHVRVASACELGEGPGWDAARNEVRWLDILGGELHRAAADGGQHRTSRLERKTSYAALTADGDYLLVAEDRLARFDPTTGESHTVLPFEADNPLTRSNDARVDTHGSLWLSSMGLNAEPGAGSLYRLHRGELTRLRCDLSIPNAICFSPDGQYAYYTDTPTARVMRWRLDAEGWPAGTDDGVEAPEPWADLRHAGGGPDGAVIDAEGCLWVALWGAGRVARLDSQGREIAHVALPASQPSCPVFGGGDLGTLYITTAREGMTSPGASDGSLFAVDLSPHGIRGLEEPRLKLS